MSSFDPRSESYHAMLRRQMNYRLASPERKAWLDARRDLVRQEQIYRNRQRYVLDHEHVWPEETVAEMWSEVSRDGERVREAKQRLLDARNALIAVRASRRARAHVRRVP